jgi:hypothetical protein
MPAALPGRVCTLAIVLRGSTNENVALMDRRGDYGYGRALPPNRFRHQNRRWSSCASRNPNSPAESRMEAALRGAWCLPYAVSRMKDLLLTLLHLAVMTAKLCGPVACAR